MSRLRATTAGLVAAAAAVAFVGGCGAPSKNGTKSAAASSVPDKPKSPVTLNILDIAGNLALTKGMIEDFIKANPDVVKNVTYTKAPAPSMSGKLQAQQAAGRVSINLVLTGTDGLSAGIKNNLFVKVLPDYESRFPGLMENYQPPAAAMQELAQGQAIEVVYYPSGPLIEYSPSKVSSPPTTPAELLSWAKAHPGRFQYADPANSGPGRTLLMGLPYLLGDKDPADPDKGWDKTWAYLKQLGKYTKSYGSGTGETMRNLAAGSVDMVASTTGWDINPRVLGTVPNTVKVGLLQPMTWVTDAQYVAIPKGVSADVLAADLALIKFMLQPKEQAIAYDDGYFFPGPAVRDVTIDMAPAKSQQTIARFGRPEYEQWISQYEKKTPLPADKQVFAFDKWNKLIGSGG